MNRRQGGFSTVEIITMLVMAALVITMLAVAFRRSLAYGLAAVGVGLGTAMLVFIYAVVREWRTSHQREKRIRSEMERAAATLQAALEATFFGDPQVSPAAFGVAGAARKLLHARDDLSRVAVAVLDFDEIAAAFARPDRTRFRLEVRTRGGPGGGNREAHFVLVARREDAERWVRVLAPHFGDRVRLLTELDKEEGGSRKEEGNRG